MAESFGSSSLRLRSARRLKAPIDLLVRDPPNFDDPQTAQEKRIKQYIEKYRARKTSELKAGLFKQKKRLADAERMLKSRDTKKAREDQHFGGFQASIIHNFSHS